MYICRTYYKFIGAIGRDSKIHDYIQCRDAKQFYSIKQTARNELKNISITVLSRSLYFKIGLIFKDKILKQNGS